MLLSKNALSELQMRLSFTQMRFDCSLKLARVFHVVTTVNSSGEAVVQYFSGQTDKQPEACGSFVRMEDDNSLLAKLCHLWGLENGKYEVGKWGHGQGEDRLYIYPAFRRGLYHWYNNPDNRIHHCDTDYHNIPSLTPGDFWKVYVR